MPQARVDQVMFVEESGRLRQSSEEQILGDPLESTTGELESTRRSYSSTDVRRHARLDRALGRVDQKADYVYLLSFSRVLVVWYKYSSYNFVLG